MYGQLIFYYSFSRDGNERLPEGRNQCQKKSAS